MARFLNVIVISDPNPTTACVLSLFIGISLRKPPENLLKTYLVILLPASVVTL
jgi:hypothetical protein